MAEPDDSRHDQQGRGCHRGGQEAPFPDPPEICYSNEGASEHQVSSVALVAAAKTSACQNSKPLEREATARTVDAGGTALGAIDSHWIFKGSVADHRGTAKVAGDGLGPPCFPTAAAKWLNSGSASCCRSPLLGL